MVRASTRSSNRSSRRSVVSAAAFEALEKRELMSAGQLDTTFGSGGRLASQVLPFTPLAFAVQKDGKTLAIGSADTNFAVARINTNGTLDTPFGPRGDRDLGDCLRSVPAILSRTPLERR